VTRVHILLFFLYHHCHHPSRQALSSTSPHFPLSVYAFPLAPWASVWYSAEVVQLNPGYEDEGEGEGSAAMGRGSTVGMSQCYSGCDPIPDVMGTEWDRFLYVRLREPSVATLNSLDSQDNRIERQGSPLTTSPGHSVQFSSCKRCQESMHWLCNLR